jgi:hypothetical protein
VPGLTEQITAMRQHGDEMWARAGREIAAAYATRTSPLQAFAALPATPPVRHLYAEPADPSFLAAQQDFARTHPWFTVRRLDTARTHFPMLERPADLASDLTRFVGSLGRREGKFGDSDRPLAARVHPPSHERERLRQSGGAGAR